jgi:hypothetical protein
MRIYLVGLFILAVHQGPAPTKLALFLVQGTTLVFLAVAAAGSKFSSTVMMVNMSCISRGGRWG